MQVQINKNFPFLNFQVKEEKHPVGGPDPGGGGGSNGPLGYDPQSMDMSNMSHNQGNKIGGIPDDLLMNGGDIKMENPPTPHQHSECPPDIPPLGDLGHDFPPDCELQLHSHKQLLSS